MYLLLVEVEADEQEHHHLEQEESDDCKTGSLEKEINSKGETMFAFLS